MVLEGAAGQGAVLAFRILPVEIIPLLPFPETDHQRGKENVVQMTAAGVHLLDVVHVIRIEDARHDVSVPIDINEPADPARGQTAAGSHARIPEIDDEAVVVLNHVPHGIEERAALVRWHKQVEGVVVLADGHVLEHPGIGRSELVHVKVAKFVEPIDEQVGVFAGDGDGKPEHDADAPQVFHGLEDAPVHASAATGVGFLLKALHGNGRRDIAQVAKAFRGLLGYQRAVGIDEEQVFRKRLENVENRFVAVAVHERLPARDDGEIRAPGFLFFLEDAHDRREIEGDLFLLIAVGVTTDAIEIAVGRRAQEEKVRRGNAVTGIEAERIARGRVKGIEERFDELFEVLKRDDAPGYAVLEAAQQTAHGEE